MGLDNELRLYTKKPLLIDVDTPRYVQFEEHHDTEEWDGYIYDILYFRKSWAFREMMYKVLEKHGIKFDEPIACRNGCWEFAATYDVIFDIRQGLFEFLMKPETWDARSQVFFIADVFEVIAADLLALTWLMQQLPNIPGAFFEFIDSY